MPGPVRLERGSLPGPAAEQEFAMQRNVRSTVLIALGGLSLSACATTKYVDEQIAMVNGRIDTVAASAQQANAAAQQAQATAQAAQAAAQANGQRIDALSSRVDALEAAKRPRN